MNECRCGRATLGSATLCRACGADLRAELAALPALVDELEVTLARQAHTGVRTPGGGTLGKGEHQPLPFDAGASQVLGDLHRWAAWWRAELAPRHNPGVGRTENAVRAALSAVLAAEPLTRDSQDAPALLEGAQRLRARAVAVIDLPRHETWLGPCRAHLVDEHGVTVGECTGSVRGLVDEAVAACRTCGAQHDALTRRRWLLDTAAADGEQLNVLQLARLLAGYGVGGTPVAARSALRRLVTAGRLVAVDADERDRPLYRLSDVLEAFDVRTRAERRTA